MTQAHRGLANTALGVGDDVSASITQLYAPPGAWSHGYLWGADIVTIPRGAATSISAQRRVVKKPANLRGGVDSEGGPVRTRDRLADCRSGVNQLVGPECRRRSRSHRSRAQGDAARGQRRLRGRRHDEGDPRHGRQGTGAAFPAGPRGLTSRARSGRSHAADRRPDGRGESGRLVAAEPRLHGRPDFDRDDQHAAHGSARGLRRRLQHCGNWPSATNPLARTRLTAFFARGGGYLGAGANGGNFLTAGAELVGLTAVSRSGNGRSGILFWENTLGAASPVVGAYPAMDTLIADPPTWFSTLPTTLIADGRLPATGTILAAGLWLMDPLSATAPGSAVISHGTNAAGTARVTLFANNPLYRADPEREWPSLGAAAYWVDQ